MIIIAGNQRYKAAREIGLKEVPTILISGLTEKKENEITIRDNVNNGEWDFSLLKEWDFNILKEWDLKIPYFIDEEKITDNYQIPETLKTDIKIGDIYQIGKHRLTCGDSTNGDIIKKLMIGKLANLCLTDPPWSVSYKSRKNRRNLNNILMSFIDPINAEELLNGFISNAPSNIFIMTFGDKHFPELFKILQNNKMIYIRMCIWAKQRFVFNANATYQQKYETIIYFKRGKAKEYKKIPKNVSNIFEIDREKSNDLHPTIKPIELWIKLITYHSQENDLIYDPFLGSGTTMVAAEKLKRVCYGIELSPLFCQVVINRMEENYPNIKVKKIN
jgi:DNA modification methylase